MNCVIKSFFFVLSLYIFPAVAMDAVSAEKPVDSFQEARENYADMFHAQMLEQVLVRTKAGNLDAQKQLCSFCGHPRSTAAQKLRITNTLQALIRSTKSPECRMQACCALAYLYSASKGPTVDREHFLDKTVRYLLEGYRLTIENRDRFLLKVQLMSMIDRIVAIWTTVLRSKLSSSESQQKLESQLDLLARLKRDLA